MNTKQKSRIIIADDHPIFRNGLVKVIEEDSEFEIIGEAENGEKAFFLILELKPEIALLDIHMPVMTGLQVLKELKKKKIIIKTIFLTVYADEDIFDEAMDNGINGYVLKDNAISDIKDCLRAVASGNSYISPSVSNFLVNRREKIRRLEANRPGLDKLTRTEQIVLCLLAEGMTSKEIGEEMFISPKTVENHKANMSGKLNLKGTHSLIKFAIENKAILN
ncbi:MAG: response regulator transcription factor [Bacteroidetes bacterium]|nr:response regulator transcription factor [Bacteroidota bacterium]